MKDSTKRPEALSIRFQASIPNNVAAVQQPLTSLEEDVAITRHVLTMQKGPVILVGHTYGGVNITLAGNEPNVIDLVYLRPIPLSICGLFP
jgi:hypothetical protein